MSEENVAKDTREQKRGREEILVQFLAEIKTAGQWKRFLNPRSNQLHIAEVCREMGRREGLETPWDATFFRGANWGVGHKDTFNKWVKEEIQHEHLASECDSNNPLSLMVILPKGLDIDDLPDGVMDVILDQQRELKRIKEKNALFESQIAAKERKILELQTQIEVMADDQLEKLLQARKEHYQVSIRSLSYD